MFQENAALWQRFAPHVLEVEKPSRYVGQEWGSVLPQDKPAADYHAVLMYPDVYEVGQANQAIAILYDCLNSNEHLYCERAFVPWVDMAAKMRENALPLCSLETCTPLREFDFIGITLPHELAASNVLEALDLAGIPLRASERGEDMPLVFAGGPCAYNPEPFAPFFDAVFIGEGEYVDVEAALMHRSLKQQGAARAQILEALARINGVYVPSLYTVDMHPAAEGALEYSVARAAKRDVAQPVSKRIVQDFDAQEALVRQVVPYTELVHDRLAIEILRGCNRGCRFCQAGMIYRPVRERSADSIVNAVARGLACTGYDEVSLTSLSSTDHSSIEDQLRRLNRSFSGTGMNVSLPSQRVDAFGVELARLAAGEKKGGLTLAPEAGTQRLRDAINKGVSEEDLFAAVENAFRAGWRRLKLYFMIGLPTETDEDVAGIGDLCRRVYAAAKDAVPDDQRGNVRMTVSVALFVPKAVTPFQWDGQIALEQIEHRIEVLKTSFPKKGIDLHWHDSATSYVEAALARGGRECAQLIERAWRNGARFDAWTEQFDFDAWVQAGQQVNVPVLEAAMRRYKMGVPLPWSHISSGVRERFLQDERAKADRAETTPDCTFGTCSACGVCQDLRDDAGNLVRNVTQRKRVAAARPRQAAGARERRVRHGSAAAHHVRGEAGDGQR